MTNWIARLSQGQSARPIIGITVGDPAGIGPEISVKAAFSSEVLACCRPLLIGDAAGLEEECRRQGRRSLPPRLEPGAPFPADVPGPLLLPPTPLTERTGETHRSAARFSPPPTVSPTSSDRVPIELGRAQAAAGLAAAASIETAVDLCLSGGIDAMATAPINKTSFSLAGIPFPGHTEYLAYLTGCEDFAMAFIAPRLRVALLTIHVPLCEVPRLVRQPALERLIRLVDRELKGYGISSPRLAVAGLNPHAGEGGLFGEEEQREMLPAIHSCRADAIDVSGPFPGDTLFLRAYQGEFDLVIACYHDQGLIPIKCFSFGEAVNVTLGLPLIRTSVDHGTAFDLAGRGMADASSMCAAIRLAAELARLRSTAPPSQHSPLP